MFCHVGFCCDVFTCLIICVEVIGRAGAAEKCEQYTNKFACCVAAAQCDIFSRSCGRDDESFGASMEVDERAIDEKQVPTGRLACFDLTRQVYVVHACDG